MEPGHCTPPMFGTAYFHSDFVDSITSFKLGLLPTKTFHKRVRWGSDLFARHSAFCTMWVGFAGPVHAVTWH